MKALCIDFAHDGPPRPSGTSRLFGLVGAALCLGAGLAAFDAQQRLNSQSAKLQALHERLAAREHPAPPQRAPAIAAEQARAINDVVARLNLPWSDVFRAVESATPDSIALLSLEPDAAQHAVKGLAEAKNSVDMLDYIERMGRESFFDSVVLSKHEVNEQDPNRPLRFQFLATWERSQP
ncbi:Tfp pilus assembly protein PilN [Crenobacter luteus]|uniref:PilN domain-containing protein n=1 Tax=Crenobacter luteus TaxID=1452487 RepID=UPI001051793D|nr:PilN domain-containing protein [Crenobacter luteus]TCP10613.1 Tfp pilus assembly protein PilN [Crenobacter luteus]